MTTLIVGAGAVGTVLAQFLIAGGEAVIFLVRPQRLAVLQSIKTLTVDFTVEQKQLQQVAPACYAALPTSEIKQSIKRVIICTKNEGLDDALLALKGITTNTVIVTTLNGVSHLEAIKNAFPRNQVEATTVMFNSQALGPFHANLNTRPSVLLNDPELAAALERANVSTGNWDEALFNGKLVLNLVNVIGALTGLGLNRAMAEPLLARCIVSTIVEGGKVMKAANLPFKMVGALSFEEYVAWLDGPQTHGLTVLAAEPESTVPLYSSMIADVAQGRKTEIKQLNGEIVEIAKQHGLTAPINQRLIELLEEKLQAPSKCWDGVALCRDLDL